MRIVTWNIQWGLGMDGRLDLARTIRAAQAFADFDVLCLQEVADGFADLQGSAGENQFAQIEALLPGYQPVEGIAVDLPREGGGRRRFGNMLLSRLPVGRIVRHALPWPADPTTRNMPRMLLDVEVEAPDGWVRVLTTHLEYFSAALRACQIGAIGAICRAAAARAADPPLPGTGTYASVAFPSSIVLCGDFNASPADPALSALRAGADGVPGLTEAWAARYPGVPHPHSFCISDQTWGAPHCCDLFWLSGDLVPRITRLAYETTTRASDHQPALLELASQASRLAGAGT